MYDKVLPNINNHVLELIHRRAEAATATYTISKI